MPGRALCCHEGVCRTKPHRWLFWEEYALETIELLRRDDNEGTLVDRLLWTEDFLVKGKRECDAWKAWRIGEFSV
jgi:hypothetical protein